MKKFSLLILTCVFLVPKITYAVDCREMPTCDALGYEYRESDCEGLRKIECPFEKGKYYCAKELPITCTIGKQYDETVEYDEKKGGCLISNSGRYTVVNIPSNNKCDVTDFTILNYQMCVNNESTRPIYPEEVLMLMDRQELKSKLPTSWFLYSMDTYNNEYVFKMPISDSAEMSRYNSEQHINVKSICVEKDKECKSIKISNTRTNKAAKTCAEGRFFYGYDNYCLLSAEYPEIPVVVKNDGRTIEYISLAIEGEYVQYIGQAYDYFIARLTEGVLCGSDSHVASQDELDTYYDAKRSVGIFNEDKAAFESILDKYSLNTNQYAILTSSGTNPLTYGGEFFNMSENLHYFYVCVREERLY